MGPEEETMNLFVLLVSAGEAAESAEGFDRWADGRRAPAVEVNVLWPFFPGGISDVKLLAPVVRVDRDVLRGEVVLGLHSDYGWGPLTRPADAYGKVRFVGLKAGWRQFFARGAHLDLTVNAGWRHEEDNVYDGTTLDSFSSRAWAFGGWQVDLSRRVYLNVRGGLGVHVARIGDPFAHTERRFAPGGDLNLGVRL